jgi:hypothetical protein
MKDIAPCRLLANRGMGDGFTTPQHKFFQQGEGK